MKLSQAILLALIALTLFATIARAQDADVEDAAVEGDVEEDHGEGEDSEYNPEEERDPNQISGIFARATFGSDIMAPVLPAGEKVTTFIGLSNAAENPTYTVKFAMAHLAHAGDANYFIQNFTGTRHERTIAGGETATLKYQITPDEMLEPTEYSLVIRLYFADDNNQTYVTVAYNDTITVSEPLSADPKTYLTFATIAAIIGGIGYVVMNKKKKTPTRKAATVEMGTTAAFDPDYISAEHIRFAEAQKRNGSGSPKRNGSGSPKRSSSNKQ